jgi:hypothetical protein
MQEVSPFVIWQEVIPINTREEPKSRDRAKSTEEEPKQRIWKVIINMTAFLLLLAFWSIILIILLPVILAVVDSFKE